MGHDPDTGDVEPPRWEYRTLRPPREATMKEAKDPVATLNDLGADGWELADTIDYVGGGTKLLVLKRPVATAPGRGTGTDGGFSGELGNGSNYDDGPTAGRERTGGAT